MVSLLHLIAAIAIAIQLDAGYLPKRLVPGTQDALFISRNLGCNVIAFLPGPCGGAAFFVPYVWALRVEVLCYAVIGIGVVIGAYHRDAEVGVVVALALAVLQRSFSTIVAAFPMSIVMAWASDWIAERPVRHG